MHRGLVAAATLATAALAWPAFAQGACSFERPDTWSAKATRWEGDCAGGTAQGLGVLKETQKGRVVRIFFGRMQDGRLTRGVIDQSDGYVAGEFRAGRLVVSDDRGVVVRAFDDAAQAAAGVAETYRRAGNRASAAFYDAKSRELKNQMD